MTVSDPGAGQQQGREVSWEELNLVCAERYPDGYTLGQRADIALELAAPSPTPPARDSGFTPCTDPLCPPLPGGISHGHGTPSPPARDSGRDEAREAPTYTVLVPAVGYDCDENSYEIPPVFSECSVCGAAIENETTHTRWHAASQ